MKRIRVVFAICAAFLFSIGAHAQSKEIIILAHRGGCGEGMENTMTSFKRSLDAGIRAFEIDVRITKDGKIVLQHDDTLKRTSGVDKMVEDMTEKELREITLNDGSKLAFLDEFLKLMSNYQGLYIEFEMKCRKYSKELLIDSGYCDKVAQAVLKAEPKGSTYCLSSFDTRALRYIKERYNNAKTIYITKQGCTEQTIKIAEAIGANRVAARLEKTTYEDMKHAHEKGFIVNLWPGRSDDTIIRAWALGADVHCTDYPIRLTKYAKENCKWMSIK